jgi:predicted lactoylglutathione lyase
MYHVTVKDGNSVIIGVSFASKQEADAMANRYEFHGYQATVEERPAPQTNIHPVMVEALRPWMP